MINQILNIVFPSYIRGLGITAAAIGAVGSVAGGVISARGAKKAAKAQEKAGDKSIAFQEKALAQTRADLQPFRQAGESALPGLTSLTNDPNAQKEFVTENPFFDALADEAQKRLFNNQAAKGKVGSGGTAEALQNSLLLLGPKLVQQSLDNRFRLAQLGGNAAARQGNATLQTGRDIADTTTGIGNARAAGIVGQANAIQGGIEGVTSAFSGGIGGLGGGGTSAGIGGGGGTGQMFGSSQRVQL
jgi:hypothetical protein